MPDVPSIPEGERPAPDWRRTIEDYQDHLFWCEIKFDGTRWCVRAMRQWRGFRPDVVWVRRCRTELKAQQMAARWLDKLAWKHEGWTRA